MSNKTVQVNLRATPETKQLLAAAARRNRRSIGNMLECLVHEYCQREGITIDEPIPPKTAAAQKGGQA